MQRVVEAWGGTSSGISFGDLWIIPTILMKVVRIRNAEIQVGWGALKLKPKENERRGSKMSSLRALMLLFHCVVFRRGLFLSPAATNSIVVIATQQLSKYVVVTSWFRGWGQTGEYHHCARIKTKLKKTNIFLKKCFLGPKFEGMRPSQTD